MSLRDHAVSGVKWNGISTGAVTILRFLTLGVLARNLSPTDFGLMGMIMVVIGFTQAFSDMGVSNAIIYRQDATRDQLSTLYWLNIIAGIIVFFVVISFTPLIVLFYHEPRLYNLLYLSAFILLITPLGQQFQFLMQKELKFDGLAKIEIATSIISSTIAIGAALKGFGVYSLVFGQLASALSKVAFLNYIGLKQWRPSLHFSKLDLKGYLSFGIYQMGERTVNYACANLDYIIIGHFLGSTSLGFYTVAYQIAIFPLTKFNPVITKVMFPIFSKIQNDNNTFKKGYLKVIILISFFTFPMMAGMFIIAPEFIILFLGKDWIGSINILKILCVVGIFKSLGSPVGAVLYAKGRADIGLYWNVFTIIFVGIAVTIGVNWGILGVAYAILIIQLPFFFIIHPLANRLIELHMVPFLKTLLNPLFCTFIMSTCIIIINSIIPNIGPIYTFLLTITNGALIYLWSYYIIDKATILELVKAMRSR